MPAAPILETSQHLTDWYTYSHILHGIILYWLTGLLTQGRLSVAARLVIATSIEVGWEILKTPLQHQPLPHRHHFQGLLRRQHRQFDGRHCQP